MRPIHPFTRSPSTEPKTDRTASLTRRRFLGAAAATGASAFLAGCDGSGSDATSESLRLGTFNAQFLPDIAEDPPFKHRDICCDDIPNRVDRIAKRIIASRYDVIALNEMFDAKKKMRAALEDEYPHYVEVIGDEAPASKVIETDSGLMLFSKYPFVELPNDDFRPPVRSITEESDEKGLIAVNAEAGAWEDVGWIRYDECASWDCRASKGAGLVRVQNPDSGRVYTIVFTHMQGEDARAVRAAQLARIEELVRGTLTDEQLANEDLFIVGDLNINGDREAESDREEWRSHFTEDGFFADVVRDAWETDTQHPSVPEKERDRGLTEWHAGNRERLDYILARTPDTEDGQLCVQHMTLAYNLRDGEPFVEGGMGMAGQKHLSDHIGVNADINLRADHCSPRRANVIEPGDVSDDGNVVLDGRIEHPGGVQWHLIDGAVEGTVSIAIEEGDVDFRIYQSNELSVPYQGTGYRGETSPFTYEETIEEEGGVKLDDPKTVVRETEGRTYAGLEPPFYVEVFGVNDDGDPDQTVTGEYKLVIHEHQGTSKDDALLIYPNHLGPDNTIDVSGRTLGTPERWFKLFTDAPDSGRPQHLRFFVDPMDDQAYRLELFGPDEGGTVTGHGELVTANPWRPDGPRRTRILSLERSTPEYNDERLLLKVTPEDPSGGIRYNVGWRTNMVAVHGTADMPLAVTCERQVNRAGHRIRRDDYNVSMEVFIGDPEDGERIRGPIGLGDFDGGETKFLKERVPDFDPIRVLSDEPISIKLKVDRREPGVRDPKPLTSICGPTSRRFPFDESSRFLDYVDTTREPQPGQTWLGETDCTGPRIAGCGTYRFDSFVAHTPQQSSTQELRITGSEAWWTRRGERCPD